MPQYPSPLVSVDVVLLALNDGVLHTALALRDNKPFAGHWALPGGYVHVDEDQDDVAAANRILKAKAGLSSPYFEQLGAFCGLHRDPRGWSVSIAHYALVPTSAMEGGRPDHLKWVPVDHVRSLPFDHKRILDVAVERLRSKTLYSSLPLYLMPKTFTLTELQHVYETVLGGALDKRSFRRRLEAMDVLQEVKGQATTGTGHRPAQQFRLKRRARLATVASNLDVREAD